MVRPILQTDDDAIIPDVCTGDTALDGLDPVIVGNDLAKHVQRGGIGEIVAKGFETDFRGPEGNGRRAEKPARAVNDLHRLQAGGMTGQGAPDAEAFEKGDGLIHQRRGSAVLALAGGPMIAME